MPVASLPDNTTHPSPSASSFNPPIRERRNQFRYDRVMASLARTFEICRLVQRNCDIDMLAEGSSLVVDLEHQPIGLDGGAIVGNSHPRRCPLHQRRPIHCTTCGCQSPAIAGYDPQSVVCSWLNSSRCRARPKGCKFFRRAICT